MTSLVDRLAALDWTDISAQLDAHGHAHLRGLLPAEWVIALAASAPAQPSSQQSTDTARHKSGRQHPCTTDEQHPNQQLLFDGDPCVLGEQQSCITTTPDHPSAAAVIHVRSARQRTSSAPQPVFGVQQISNTAAAELVQAQPLHLPLSESLQQLCALLRQHLQPIAERWEPGLHDAIDPQHYLAILQHIYAGGHQDLQRENLAAGTFPLTVTAALNTAGLDFQGGEWIFVEQRPRMQSRPMVVQPQLGDVVIFSNAQRPLKIASGYTRAQMTHGISRVHSGVRIGLQLRFSSVHPAAA